VPEWARPQSKRQGRGGGRGGKGGGPRGAKGGGGKRERLQKVMAQSGYGSRRNIEILIAQGHLTINGQVAKLGDSVGPGDKVKLDGNVIQLRFGVERPRVLMYHKPEGEIVTRDDPEKRPTVFDKLPKVNGGRWVSVGRLDLNTGGLLLFTTNGELANKLTHPRFEVEREYAVRVMGEITEESRKKLLETGVDIDGELCTFDSIEDRGGEGSNHWYHVVLREGKNREVRRMMEAVGLMVSRLMRVRFGSVALPGFLKRGMLREMDEDQVLDLMAFAGVNEAPPAAAPEDQDVEDPNDSIGNRIDPRAAAREQEPDDLDDDVGNRFHAPPPDRPEPDGNRGTYNPMASGERPPKGQRGHERAQGQGQGHGQGQGQGHGQGQGRRHGKPHGGKPFAFGKKRGHGQGGGNQAQVDRDNRGNQQPRQHSPGQGQPQEKGPGGQPGQPGQGKGKRHRNRNRNRNRGGGGGGNQAQPAGGEQQPPSNGNDG
jgi:23S rRNA pseudouridine2605 synthase